MRIILTNMCMVYDNEGNILVQDRVSKDWPGLTFPGGHVEDNETIEESVIREIKEETGLTISSVECCGTIEWLILEEEVRHVTVLYKTNKFQGTIKSSDEGKVFWINKKDIDKYKLSNDFDKILETYFKNL